MLSGEHGYVGKHGSRTRARYANGKGAQDPKTGLNCFGIDAAAAFVDDKRVRDLKRPQAWNERYFARFETRANYSSLLGNFGLPKKPADDRGIQDK
ncbi:MAG: hypothetical protein AAF628_07235 [Planctomycetota bacterium]